MRPVRSKTFLATLSVLVVVAGTLVGANVASADSVQYQSYGRASQTEACTAQVGETPWQASWGTDSSWKPSWEQWANAGKGGWTCGRSITWARDSAARTYALGAIGPGGGLVFLISGGRTYEMAKKTWSGSSSDDTPTLTWCSDTTTSIAGAVGTAVGTGSANTTAMQPAACTSGAGVSARAYRGGGFSDWFLPSKDELNAMCNYSRNPSSPAAPSIACSGIQNGAFSSGDYGFASDYYWSSSESNSTSAWLQGLGGGFQFGAGKAGSYRPRPVRAF